MPTQRVYPRTGVIVPNEYTSNAPYPAGGYDVPLPYSRNVSRALLAKDLLDTDPGNGSPDVDPTQYPWSGTTLTLANSMNGRDIKLTNAGGCAVTVPATLVVGSKYPIFVMPGAGQATFTGSGGMTIYPPRGLAAKSYTGGSGMSRLTIEILSATEACLSGDCAAS